MQLYQKIMLGKRTTYKPYEPNTKVLPDIKIESEQVISVLGTLIVSITQAIQGQLKPSDILHRKIRNVNNELIELVRVGFEKPTPLLVDIGVEAWNAAILAIQEGLLRDQAGLSGGKI